MLRIEPILASVSDCPAMLIVGGDGELTAAVAPGAALERAAAVVVTLHGAAGAGGVALGSSGKMWSSRSRSADGRLASDSLSRSLDSRRSRPAAAAAETATAAADPATYPAMRFTLKYVKEPKFQQHMAELLQQVSYFKQHASALGWSGEDLPTRDTVPCLITNCYTNLYNGLPQIEAQSGGKWKGTYYESSKV